MRPSPQSSSPILPVGLLSLLFLAGCAVVPETLEPVPEVQPGVAEVRANPEAAVGQTVVWGGVIAELSNRADGARLEIVARPLAGDARPRADESSLGRFRAFYPDFLEPEVYSRGREVTVRGEITGVAEGRIDEFPYVFPEVQASSVHLWPRPPREPQVIYRDPFWDPWWPNYRHPWGPTHGFYRHQWPWWP
jgi:outer membrane lipoprotein